MRADGLKNLNQNNQYDYRYPQDNKHATLIAQVQGHGTQSAAANGAGHGAIAENGDESGSKAGDQRRQAFRKHNFPDDLERRAAHGLSRFHNAFVNLAQRSFHQARHKGKGCNDQGNDGGNRADAGAEHYAGEWDDQNHQNQERHTAQQVDDHIKYVH